MMRWQERAGEVNNHLVDYPTPSNLSFNWSYGVLSGVSLGIQIVTGIVLAMHYEGGVETAYESVEHIMRDVRGGWIIRYMHSNGASMFFIVVYCHMLRGMYYGSYKSPRGGLWVSGVVILLLMIITSFIGYVLPWGQMSLWGATVITNLVTAVPVVGKEIVFWLWGGYSIENATLKRFYALHYLLPFVLVGGGIGHIGILHSGGSSNGLGIESSGDRIGFYPYFFVKDVLAVIGMVLISSIIILKGPNVLNHSDNYIRANGMKTPEHIVPEWYFLPFYAILRTIEGKLTGVVGMLSAILCLLVLPFVSSGEVRSNVFRPIGKRLFWVFVGNVLILGWVGQQEIEYPYVSIGVVSSIYYFVHVLVWMPIVGGIEGVLVRR